MTFEIPSKIPHKNMNVYFLLYSPPGSLKETEGGEVIGRFEEVCFGGSFMDDAEAVELHDASVSVFRSVSHRKNTRTLLIT